MFWRIILAAQVTTFLLLGVYYLTRGNPRLGAAQLLLACVQAIIYSQGL